MTKTRVAVLRGGPSDEYDVSLMTGGAVLRAIDTNQYEPIDVVITKNGEWLVGGIVKYPERILSTVDIVFNALHGSYGEDGTVQRLMDTFGVPYTGSKALPSSIAMHKALTKKMLQDTGILMAPHVTVRRDSFEDVHALAKKITDTFGPQYVIKPVASGSSVGTMMVKNPALLPQALEDSLSRYDEVIVEARIQGREATCGVIERFRDTELYALPPIEIIPPASAEFFNNEVKYNGATQEICPGNFDIHTKHDIESASRLIHSTLNLSQYSRSDFIVNRDGVYFLEVNTLPGLTEESLLPRALAAVGSTYESFISHLLTDALERK